MDIAIILFLLIIFCSVRKTKCAFDFSKDQTMQWKGVCAVAVVLGHLTQIIDGGVISEVFWNISLLGFPVPIFFFISGYGLTKSLQRGAEKENYWKQFAKKKAFQLLIPLAISGTIYFIVLDVLLHKAWSINQIIKNLYAAFCGIFSGMPITLNAWYVYLLCAFCVLFAATFRDYKAKEENRKTIKRIVLIVCEITILICLMLFALRWGGWWSKSCYAFPMGIVWGFYGSRLKMKVKKYKYWLIVVGLLIYVLPYICENIIPNALINKLGVVWYPVSAMVIIMWLLVFQSKLCWKSKMFGFLGKYSFEIYLFHGLVYTVLAKVESIKAMTFVFAMLTLAFSVVIALPMRKLFLAIQLRWGGIKNG